MSICYKASMVTCNGSFRPHAIAKDYLLSVYDCNSPPSIQLLLEESNKAVSRRSTPKSILQRSRNQRAS
jgi:hypothetical protein